jgi:hypothetical protein
LPTIEDIRELLRWREALARPVDEQVTWQPTVQQEDGVYLMEYPM